MYTVGIDIGGTKISSALFDSDGNCFNHSYAEVGKTSGDAVCDIVLGAVSSQLEYSRRFNYHVGGVGLCVPGIYWSQKKTVWAPNINGWEDYPLFDKVTGFINNPDISVNIDSDRACCILGEVWKGAAMGAKNAIYMAVGTGIGIGVLINGEVLRGANDIAGATGWLALERPFNTKYTSCGCFEYSASGAGLGRKASELLTDKPDYQGNLRNISPDNITGRDVFEAFFKGDEIAKEVIINAIELWGMAVANYVSLFNPEVIILGGGVFGPAVQFIPAIYKEAKKWAQPLSVNLVKLTDSKLGTDAGLFGAGYLAGNFQIKT